MGHSLSLNLCHTVTLTSAGTYGGPVWGGWNAPPCSSASSSLPSGGGTCDSDGPKVVPPTVS